MKTTVRPEDMLSELGPLRRYARSLARNGDDAEDLVQAALVRALERRASFRHSGSLRGWLLAILHNVFIDGRRARQAEAARETAQLHLIPEAIPSSQEERSAWRRCARPSSGYPKTSARPSISWRSRG